MKTEVRIVFKHDEGRAWRLCPECADEVWVAATDDLLAVREPQDGECCEMCGKEMSDEVTLTDPEDIDDYRRCTSGARISNPRGSY